MFLHARIVQQGVWLPSPYPPFKVRSGDPQIVADYTPKKWLIKRAQDNVGSWSFEVAYPQVWSDRLREYSFVYFYIDGNEIMHGIVDDVSIQFSDGEVVYSVSGLGEVEELGRVLSKNLSHYQNVEVIVILQDLLEWAGWALGDFSTMLEPTIPTTIDLRDCRTVLEQVQRVCGSVPGLHWRWGGYNCLEQKILDVGFFDDETDYHLQQGTALSIIPAADNTVGQIEKIEIRESWVNLISEIHGNGGTYNLTSDPDKQRVIGMWHVNQLFLSYPALEDPNYPIVTDGHDFLLIRNDSLYPDGGSVREVWDFMVTQNDDPPTTNELALAAYGLYLKCVRYLQEHENTDKSYNATVFGLVNFTPPSSRVRLDANYAIRVVGGGTVVDGVTMPIEDVSLHDTYRVGSWEIQGDNDDIKLTTLLTEFEFVNIDDTPENDVVIMADYAEGADIKPRASGTICADYVITVVQDDVTDVVSAGNAADCALCDIVADGISVTIGFTPPASTSKVKLMGIAATPAVPFTYEITQQPTISGGAMGDPLIICFRFTDHAWDVADAVTLKSYFRFWGN